MNRRWRGALFCALGAVAAYALLGTAYRMSGEARLNAPKVQFSKSSGFYDDEFDLEIRSDGGVIYYTLDCTEPDENALRYAGPIHIGDASVNENVYSEITDVSVYCNPELMERNVGRVDREYKPPKAPVDKATVVRAVCVDARGVRSPVAEAVYFVGFGQKEDYRGLNVISITTDPDNLFSEKRGIYVLGRHFSQIVHDGIVDAESDSPMLWDANYQQRGLEWERPATARLYDENREEVFSMPCGIRIQGGASRVLLPKSLNLYARRQYGPVAFDTGSLFFRYNRLESLNLSSGGNDANTLLKDYIVNALAEDLAVATREYVPCAVFLEGEYWGNGWLTPRYKRDYLSQKYGEEADNIVIIKNGALEEGQETDLALYDDMRKFIAQNDMRQEENYQRACELLDIQSCIDYYAAELYLANTDWPCNNVSLWRTRRRGLSDYSDGRWRWMVFDMNLAMRGKNATLDMLPEVINQDPVFAGLMENERFSQALYARLLDLADDIFKPDRTDAFIAAYEEEMAAAMANAHARFSGDDKSDKAFLSACESTRQFFHDRSDFIINQYGGNQP